MSQKTPKDYGSLNREAKHKCPECGGPVEYENGEFICQKCGLVVE